jgi:hypothetical protein
MYLFKYSKYHKRIINTLLENKNIDQLKRIYSFKLPTDKETLASISNPEKYTEEKWRQCYLYLKSKYDVTKKTIYIPLFDELMDIIEVLDISTESRKKIHMLIKINPTLGGATKDDVKQFRKLLKKHTPTAIPKTHLLKKSDLKKHAKIYVVKSPAYDKVTLLKNKDEFSSSDKWIHVNEKSLKWLMKCSKK